MKILLAIYATIQSFYISAGDLPTDTLKIDEVIVTGTKTSRNIKEVPGRVSVIKADNIEFSAIQQADDLLRTVPGINVNRSTGIYSQRPVVTLRGLSGDEQSRTLVLINGVPVNTSDEGGVNWNRINPFDIERIEVFKGPGSSLYGSNAMGGVINIITKKPSQPQEVYGGLSYGTFNTLRQDLNIRIRNVNGYYGSVSQYYLQSDGYNNVPEPDRTPHDIPRSLDELSLSARVGNDSRQWLRWELQYDIFRDKRGEGYQVYTPGGCYRNFNTNSFRGSLTGGDGRTRYDMNVYYQLENYYDVNERLRGENYSRFDVNSFREDKGLLFSGSRNIFESNTLTAGFELKRGGIEGGDYFQTPRITSDDREIYDTVYNAGVISTIAAYVQDEHAFADNKIRIIGGLRLDRVVFDKGAFYSTDPWNTMPELKSNAWTAFSPRLGLRVNMVEDVSAYLSYSHGFRASILDDLTRTGWMWVGPKYANPDLGPESLDNFEMGVDILPLDELRISASFYYGEGKDFLYYIDTGDQIFGRPVYRRENVTGVALHGLEADVGYDLSDRFILLGSYTFASSKINSFTERPDLENKYLRYVPRHSASASLVMKSRYFNTSLLGFYKGEQFGDDANSRILDPYFTFDFQVSGKIRDNYMISLDIKDVFDNRQMENLYYLSPGRVITARTVIKF